MTTLTLADLGAFLKKIKTPEELFGHHPGMPADEARTDAHEAYRRFSKIAHPDLYRDDGDKALATVAQGKINTLWVQAEARLSAGIYGSAYPNPAVVKDVIFETKKNRYAILERLATGQTGGIFRAAGITKSGSNFLALVKVPHAAADNDLMKREADAYGLMRKKAKAISVGDDGERLAKIISLRVPSLIESLSLSTTGSTEKKTVNAFLIEDEYKDGWYTLDEIRQAHPVGVDPRIAVFIFNRILEALTFAHESGVAHCAIVPNHVLIHAKSHMGQLIDWTASCKLGSADSIPYSSDRFAAFYPQDMTPSRSLDIYMGAMCFAKSATS